MITSDRVARDKRYNSDVVLKVIKIYRFMVYVKTFVTVNCGACRIKIFKALCMLLKWMISDAMAPRGESGRTNIYLQWQRHMD